MYSLPPRRCAFLSLILAILAVAPVAKEKAPAREECATELRGLFAESKFDAAIPLCEQNYPDPASKATWLVVLYTQDQNTEVGKYFDVQVNKIAMDFGNFAQRGKFAAKGSQSKAKKHRKQITWLADKYDFTPDLTLPKKGLSGTDPLLKVGAVCCDCGARPKMCPDGSFLVGKLIHGGKEITIDEDVRKIPETVRAVLEAMGYVKVAEKRPEVFGVSENEEEL